jgi:predicted alpha/beta-fold hydrolase
LDWGDFEDSTPIVVLLHGLEGSSQSGYAYQCYRHLAEHGIRVVGFNFRSCSGELNRSPRLYHSGDTADIVQVLDVIKGRYPNAPLGAIGVSLGGNVILKHLGEFGSKTHVSAAVAVSVPYDLSACADAIHLGASRLYGRHLLKKLQHKVAAKRRELDDVCDVKRGLAARTMREFDDAVTAPAFGFDGAEDYYTRCSSKYFLSEIRVPTLILSATDDPFLPADSIPRRLISDAAHVTPVFCDRGGHVGFVEGTTPLRPSFWSEREGCAHLARALRTA